MMGIHHSIKRRKRAAVLLAGALLLPVATPSQAVVDDMFGVMFRMMLVMMNVMSDAMLGNDNNWGNNFGGMNSLNMGMSAAPMMSGFGSPWSGFGNSPWNSSGGYPFAGAPGNAYAPYAGGYGSPSRYGAPPPYPATSLLEGRWYGNSGEILEVRGNHFQLRTAAAALGGKLSIENNIVSMYSPQTNTVTRYTFMRNQSELLLNNGSGVVQAFRKHPNDGAVHVF
jgi:hypothetical protein